MVVPHSLRGEVLQVVHGAVGSGHFGVTKTLRRLRLGFYWGQHKRDVEDFCRRCDGCTARKGPAERSHWNILLINQCEERITRSVGGGAWENRRVGACTLKGLGLGMGVAWVTSCCGCGFLPLVTGRAVVEGKRT